MVKVRSEADKQSEKYIYMYIVYIVGLYQMARTKSFGYAFVHWLVCVYIRIIQRIRLFGHVNSRENISQAKSTDIACKL